MLRRLNCFLARVSVFLIAAALIAGMTGCDYNPPPSKDLEIWTWYDLDDVRDNLEGHHILMNDLDSTTAGYDELAGPTANGGKGWEPIGSYSSYHFQGSFDGQRYEIRDLFIDRPDELGVGLLGFVDEGGVIGNVGMVNATVTGGDVVGELVGGNAGTVSNSHSEGSVAGGECVGSLVGANEWVGTLNMCHSNGSVTGESRVGGLVGDNRGNVNDSYSTSGVTGNSGVGGLAGLNIDDGSLNNSFFNYDEVLINGENIITVGALFDEDFDEWLANDKFLDISERLSQENGYYVVNNVTDFKELLAFGQNATLKFRLTRDLDLGDEPGLYIPYLAGEFDGNGHRISNLSFNFDFVYNVGLFGHLASGAHVTDLTVDNVNITGDCSVGGLAGRNMGSVTNSSSDGNVSGINRSVGGLVGHNRGTVSNSYSTASVTGDDNIGGLLGFNEGTMSNSYATGSVTDEWSVDSLAGLNTDTMYNPYSNGTPPPIPDSVGGLVGENHGTVSDSYSTGSVTGNENAGGLVGLNQAGTVSNSFWDTETSGQDTSDGGTGKTTAQMKTIATFSDAGWDIITVALNETNPAYIWNIVDDVTYPFLSWQP
jgi:hypothetical protein